MILLRLLLILANHYIIFCYNLRVKSVVTLRNDEIDATKLYAHGFSANPMSDKFSSTCFHHVEFYCGDATSTYKRFMLSLGLELTVKSDQSTGNSVYASYGLKSNDLRMIFTAPYYPYTAVSEISSPLDEIIVEPLPIPGYCRDTALEFTNKHGLAVRAVAIEVINVHQAYSVLLQNGATSVLVPTRVDDCDGRGFAEIAEVSLYGDVVLRLLNVDDFNGEFLPNFKNTPTSLPISPWMPPSSSDKFGNLYGLERFDHIVGNLYELQPTVDRFKAMTGFHEFAEFTTDEVGTVDSGLNSVVLANNNEAVLLPLNEPTFGTARKSQIQTFLEQNAGEGVQHMALFTPDIFHTLTCMRAVSAWGGFEFMERPRDDYYDRLRTRLGDALSDDQYRQVKELGLLADRDDEGVLLQIFTKPVGDRPTLFLEIIQRIGCETNDGPRPGCGGFGKGNFRDLFQSIEDYERTLKI